MIHVMERLQVSERRACMVVRQSRMSQPYPLQVRYDEEPLSQRIIELECESQTGGTPLA